MCGSGGESPEMMDGGSGIQDAGAPAAGCPPLPGHIRVTVRYEYGADHPPINLAEVEMSGPNGAGGFQSTGASGEVTFRDLAPGTGYQVTARHRCTTDGTTSTSVTEDRKTPVEIIVTPIGTSRGPVNNAKQPTQ